MKRILKIALCLATVFALMAVTILAGCNFSGSDSIQITANENYASGDSQSDTSEDGSSGSGNGGYGSLPGGSSSDSNSSEDSDSSSDDNSGSGTGSSDSGSSGSSSNAITTYTKSDLSVNYEVATSSADTRSVAENLLSVATVYADTTRQYSSSGGMMSPGGSTSFQYHDVYTGSSVIFSIEDDYIYFVTCYHVVYNEDEDQIADELYVYLYGSSDESDATSTKTVGSTTYYLEVEYGGDAIACDYVGGSWAEDVAVLRAAKQDVLDVNESVQAVTFAEDYSVGEDVTAIGNYAGAGISVTKGSIAVDSETIDLTLGSTTNEFRVMRLDLNIYSGNSGGGLFDADGYYIGMVNAMSTAYTNYTFAIPASKVVKSIENIIYYANYQCMYTADLGIEVEAASSKYVYDSTTDTGAIVESVAISSVTSGTAAETMGLEKGDIITAVTVDGKTYNITRTYDVEELELIIFTDSVVTVSYTRSGTAHTTDEYTFSSSRISQH